MTSPVDSNPPRSAAGVGRGFALRPIVYGIGGVGLLVALAFLLVPRVSPPPIPVPPNLGTLDPQVRAHLAQIATKAGQAPRDANLRATLGLAFAVNGLWAEARQSFRDALLLGETSPLPKLYGAVALQELGDYQSAAQELRTLVDQHPTFAPGWYRLGRALLDAGDFAAATEAFTRVTQLAESSWHGWAGLGESLLRAGNPAAALEPLSRARRQDPSARSVRHLLGQALQAAGKTNEAQTELAAGGAQTVGPMPDPWSLQALDHMKALPDQFERADALMAAGDFQQAADRLAEAYRFHPSNATVIASLARALNGSSRAQAAWDLLVQARTRAPDDLALLTASVDTASALERTNDAIVLAQRALSLAPRAAEAHVAHANALLSIGHDTEAIDALRQAIQLAPKDATLWMQLGDIQRHNLRNPEAAITAYQTASRTDPLLIAPYLARFSLHLERRERAEAAQILADLRTITADVVLLRNLEQQLNAAAQPR